MEIDIWSIEEYLTLFESLILVLRDNMANIPLAKSTDTNVLHII